MCGVPAVKPIDPNFRIVGGIEAVRNSWPWQASIQDRTSSCGAILFNNMVKILR